MADTSSLEVQIDADGRLQGISIVGFEGRVDQRSTPARKAPVLADGSGHVVRLQGPSTGGQTGGSIVPAIASLAEYPEAAPLPGVATRIGPFEAYANDVVVVLGAPELRGTQAVRGGTWDGVLGALRNGPGGREPLRCARIAEDLAVWVCQPEEALALWKELEAAHAQTVREYAEWQSPELRRAAWRLSRAAASDGARWLAIAALERSGVDGPDEAATLRKAKFREWPAEKAEAALQAAYRQLDRPLGLRSASSFSGAPRYSLDQRTLRDPVTAWRSDRSDRSAA